MMHRTRTDFWSRRGIQPLEEATVYRCPCWHTTSHTGQAVCGVCKKPANKPTNWTPAGGPSFPWQVDEDDC